MTKILTEAEIEAGKTAKGGFTRIQLEKWGVPWPPPSGWKDALLAGKDVTLNETSMFVGFTLTDEVMGLLNDAADVTAIDRNHYALALLSKVLRRGERLEIEDWWRGRTEHMEAHRREFSR